MSPQAILFAAGRGTRLRPLTNDRPKALVAVAGRSLLQRNLEKLTAAGCERVVVNVHHFAEMIMTSVEAMPELSGKVVFSNEQDRLLETGGGLLRARPLLTAPDFIAHNVDILTDLPLLDSGLLATHRTNDALVTLATRQRETSRYLLFDPDTHQLYGWTNVKTGEVRMARPGNPDRLVRRAFSGVAAYSARFFDYLAGREGEAFSVVDTWLTAAATETILAFPYEAGYWIDVGRPEAIPRAERLLEENS